MHLQAANVSYAYESGRPVLVGVSAAFSTGVITAIAGPNGSGKSTLLRLLCGILNPASGEVLLEGRPLRNYPPRERARSIAFLPQQVAPVFALTAREVVALGRFPHAGALGILQARDESAITRCLEQTAATEFAARDFNSLSGGERQRVLLASVLAQEPKLLLLDEPTSSLDLHHEMEVFALLNRLSRSGYGVAVVTHDLNLAARFCDEIILLSRDHRVTAAGPPEEVLTEDALSEAYAAQIRVGRHPFAEAPFVAAAGSVDQL